MLANVSKILLAFIDLAFDGPLSTILESGGQTEICITATLRPEVPAEVISLAGSLYSVEILANSTFSPETGMVYSFY